MGAQFGQFNYVGVGVTRGLHSSTPAIYSGSATYDKHGRNIYQGSPATSIIKYDGGSKQYLLQNIPDIFIDIGVGIGTVGIRSETQIIINTESTENPNVRVGDVVNFDRSSGGLTDQRSRVVGVGTFYFIIEDNIDSIGSIGANGNCTVTKLETFLPTGIGATGNYRGAICLNDSSSTTGDFDDFILRCHSANLSGSPESPVFTSFNYENNGAFYGPPVSGDDEQHGSGGYIFNDDGIRGDDADAAGGLASSNIGAANKPVYKRLRNTFYRYSIPTVSMEYKQVDTNPSSAGQFSFDTSGSDNFIFMNVVDVNGHDNQNFLRNTIGTGSNEGGIAQPNAYNFKITSSVKSNVGIYSSERAYVWGRIVSNVNNGNVSSSKIKYEYDIVACNVNLNADGSVPDGVFQDGTNNQSSVIEWFKSDNTSSGNQLTFFGSYDAGFNNLFLLAAQKVQNNNWTLILKQVGKSNLAQISSDPTQGIGNTQRNILPNLDYRVWNFSKGTASQGGETLRPYFKIINHPQLDTPDE